jgi:hypothetical protein
MTSRNFFQEKGYIKVLRNINRIQKGDQRKIVIVGGGNAAFEAAFLFIYGPQIADSQDYPPTKSE